MDFQIHRFSVLVDCCLDTKRPIAQKQYEDRGLIILPESYSDSGEAIRLVINCHGAGGTVTTDDSQVEHQALTQYLVANGYAVMDTNGLPFQYADENSIDLRNNIGSPIAMRCYLAAYRYCMERFNLQQEVFVHGGSMGGISSTNLVLSEQIPVIAHSAFCPVLDTYNGIFSHPWSGGLPKIALGKLYGFRTDESGEYIYDEEKVTGYNPVESIKTKKYSVSVKFWHCEDDYMVSCGITKKYVASINKAGGTAFLTTFDHGRHEPQLYGEVLKNPSGISRLNNEEIPIRPAVEGVFLWIKSFDRVLENV